MKRSQLEHIIRDAAGNANARDIVIIGSQAILATFPQAPPELLVSIEADVFPQLSTLCKYIRYFAEGAQLTSHRESRSGHSC